MAADTPVPPGERARIRTELARSMFVETYGRPAADARELSGRNAVHLLLRGPEQPDAVSCGSDQIARGLADGFRDAGIPIPDEMALVGFDSWEVMTNACRPPLTTVDPNLNAQGMVAAAELRAVIGGDAPKHGLLLRPCDLVLRQSSGSPTWREPSCQLLVSGVVRDELFVRLRVRAARCWRRGRTLREPRGLSAR
jgi:DNA-binding LacI/PurR family transcriptional regulator